MKFIGLGCLLCLLPSLVSADLKLTNRMTVQGQNTTSMVLTKNAMMRIDSGETPGATSIIVDCAGHNFIQLNHVTHTYLQTRMPALGSLQSGNSPAAQAGTITLNISRQDTGERQTMFGYKARHIKTIAIAEGGSPGCNNGLRITTDGWYVDAPTTSSCNSAEREILVEKLEAHGCRDRVLTKTSGLDTLGIPVLVDAKATSTDGSQLEMRQETANIDVETLDPALFSPPRDYTEVGSYRELIASPSSQVGAQGPPNAGPNFPPVPGSGPAGNGKGVTAGATHETTNRKSGSLNIGITQVTSSTDQSFSVEGLQQELVNQINFLGGRAVIIAADPNDRDAANEQAKQQGCDYVVFTDVTSFKAVSVGQKIGSVLSRGGLGGVGGTGHGRVEITANVKVFQPDKFTPMLDGTTDFRGNDVENTAKGLIHTEARTVMLQLKKLQTQSQ